jgi:hypothetical protein
MGPAGAQALAESSALTGLRHLQLRNTRIGAEGAAALAAGRHLRGLISLDFANAFARLQIRLDRTVVGVRAEGADSIGNEGLLHLANSPYLRNLQKLNLHNNVIGDAGARALAASPYLANLTRLDLRGNDITVAGVQAIARSPRLSQLRVLLITQTDIAIGDQDRLRQEFGDRVLLTALSSIWH